MITKIEKYGADWCFPCKILDKVLTELPEDIELVKYDVDENEELAEEKGIKNIPVLIYYDKDGKEINRTVGAISMRDILKIVNS